MRIVNVNASAIVEWGLAWACEPGQPPDCSDWVFLEAGLSCEPVVSFPCPLEGGKRTACIASRNTRAFDNEGNTLRVRRVRKPDGGLCGLLDVMRTELIRIRDGVTTTLAYVDDRCVDAGTWRMDQTQVFPDDKNENHSDGQNPTLQHTQVPGTSSVVAFSATEGSLTVKANNRCRAFDLATCPIEYRDPGQLWMLR